LASHIDIEAHPSLAILPYRALLRGGNWEARKRMVMALFSSDRGEAKPVLRQALQDPDERIRLLAAQALERLTETFRKAAQGHRRAIEQNPGDPHIKIALARLLFDRASWDGHTDAGLADHEDAARLLSSAISDGLRGAELDAAYALLGQVNAKLGRTSEAREYLDRVPETAPEYVRARFVWAETRLADGDIAAARDEMRRIAKMNPAADIANAARFWETP